MIPLKVGTHTGMIIKLQRSVILITTGFNPWYKKMQNRFGGIFGAQQPKIVTKQEIENQSITKL